VITREPCTIHADASIGSALMAMRKRNVRRLPVVDTDGRLAGIMSLDDLTQLIAEEIAAIGSVLESESPRVLARR
jgi:predicted transcriptional regulator